jgi:hypothetical protein
MSQIKSFLGSTVGLITCLVLLVFYPAHVVLVVPYLALMACPLMHLMHGGHHHHGTRNADIGRSRPAVAPMDRK